MTGARNYCPECREVTWLYESGVCPWCDAPLKFKRGFVSSQPEFSYEAVMALHAAHSDGASITELSRVVHRQLGFSSVWMARQAIERAFASCRLEVFNRPGPKKVQA